VRDGLLLFVFCCIFLMVAAISTPHVPGNRLPSLSFILNRQWALKTFNLWDTELAFIEKCIETDVRNNSAWNQVHLHCFVTLACVTSWRLLHCKVVLRCFCCCDVLWPMLCCDTFLLSRTSTQHGYYACLHTALSVLYLRNATT
jgi:hypothetical protein